MNFPINKTQLEPLLDLSTVFHESNSLFLIEKKDEGKTHLLRAIGNQILGDCPDMNVLYVRSEDFVEDVILSLRDGTLDALKSKYISAKILLIDDIQNIDGKRISQCMLHDILSIALETKNRIVLSSDRHPTEIQDLNYSLASYFLDMKIVDV